MTLSYKAVMMIELIHLKKNTYTSPGKESIEDLEGEKALKILIIIFLHPSVVGKLCLNFWKLPKERHQVEEGPDTG